MTDAEQRCRNLDTMQTLSKIAHLEVRAMSNDGISVDHIYLIVSLGAAHKYAPQSTLNAITIELYSADKFWTSLVLSSRIAGTTSIVRPSLTPSP